MSGLTKRGTPRRRDYTPNRAPAGSSLLERYMHHLRPQPNECWHLALTPCPMTGYAKLQFNKQAISAHRFAYQQFVGPIAEGMHLDHLCRNRRCVNPAHLEPVTPGENQRRSPLTNMNKATCPRGHEYDNETTYSHGGRRQCRPCRTVYIREWTRLGPKGRAERKANGLPVVDLDAYFASKVAA